MSVTGLDLRRRLRQRAARELERLAALLDAPEDVFAAPHPAAPPAAKVAPKAEPEAAPAPAPAPKAEPKAALPPLPALDKPTPPKPGARKTKASPVAKAPPKAKAEAEAAPKAEPASSSETPAGAKAKASPEDRQRAHWERTRQGLLRFIDEQGGAVSLRDLHAHSERTYFVAHVGFSRMMEELTDQGLLDYDHDSATAKLTPAGKTELA